MITPLSNTVKGVAHYWLTGFAFFVIGCVFHAIVYESIEPVVASIIFYAFGVSLAFLPRFGGVYEGTGFHLIFSICWFMASIAAIYTNYLNVGYQGADDARFYSLASGGALGMSITEIQAFTEGSGAVIIWRSIYEVFSAFGLEKNRYLGLLVNITSVAFTCVLAIKMARLIYGNDIVRFKRLITLFSLCGLFWLFASIHLRDALVLLVVTALAYVWTLYLKEPRARNLIILLGSSILAITFFKYLRWEFRFVPYAMVAAGLTAILFFEKSRGSKKIIVRILSLIAIAILFVLLLMNQEIIFDLILGNNERYLAGAANNASSDSLGMALIVNQPMLLRLILGSAYLLVFPIPFWSGFQLESAYHLFKSFNVLFFYIFLPLAAHSLLVIFQNKYFRTPVLMFQLFVFLGFTFAIAVTSLENRHFGVFFVPLFLLALASDLTLRKYRNMYKAFLIVFLFIIFVMHIAWIILKF